MWLIYAAVIFSVLRIITFFFDVDESIRGKNDIFDKYLSDWFTEGRLNTGCGCLTSIVIGLIIYLMFGPF